MAVESLTVQILDRDYRLSCEPSERDALLAAVAHVDEQMRSIRDHGRVSGAERIAVLAALNIAGALLSQMPAVLAPSTTPVAPPVADPEILRRMQAIDALLDNAFAGQERLF
jgi:cell division protein ZapA